MQKKTGTTEGWLELLWNFWVVFDVSPGSGNRCTLWLMVAESGFLPQPVVRWMVLPSPVDQPASFSSAAAESRPPVCTEVAPQRERRPPKKTLFWGKTCTGWVELGWEHCDFRGLLASACCLIWERVGYGDCGGKSVLWGKLRDWEPLCAVNRRAVRAFLGYSGSLEEICE